MESGDSEREEREGVKEEENVKKYYTFICTLNNSNDTKLIDRIVNLSFHFCTPSETIVMALQEGQKCFRGLVPPASTPFVCAFIYEEERGEDEDARQPRARGLIRCKCMCTMEKKRVSRDKRPRL